MRLKNSAEIGLALESDMLAAYAGIAAAVVLSALVVFLARDRIPPPGGGARVDFLGAYSPLLTWSRHWMIPVWRGVPSALRQRLLSHRLALGLEHLAIGRRRCYRPGPRRIFPAYVAAQRASSSSGAQRDDIGHNRPTYIELQLLKLNGLL